MRTDAIRRPGRQATLFLALLSLTHCKPKDKAMDPAALQDFATRYTAAWCSQHPEGVAAFFEDSGSLTINDGRPAVGRAEITKAAEGFMTAFPDLVVRMDTVEANGSQAIYRWTLIGTNTGPGGSGRPVTISGYEEWTIGATGLIAASLGHFDEAEYRRQVQAPTAASGAP